MKILIIKKKKKGERREITFKILIFFFPPRGIMNANRRAFGNRNSNNKFQRLIITHRSFCRTPLPSSTPFCSRGSCRSSPFPPLSSPAHRGICKRNPFAWFALARILSARRNRPSNKRSDRGTEPAHFPAQNCCLPTEQRVQVRIISGLINIRIRIFHSVLCF